MAANKGHSADEYWAAYQRLGSARAVAREFGVRNSTVDQAIKPFKTDPAIQRSMGAVGTNMVPTMAWAKTAAGEDGIAYSVLLRPAPVEDDFLDRMREAFEGMQPAKPVIAPEAVMADLCTLYPLFDVHLGMHAWGRETGGDDYDLNLATTDLRGAFAKISALTPASSEAILLVGGDFFHQDDDRAETPQSHHKLDVDGRHFKVIERGVAVIAEIVGALLEKHRQVMVRVLRGNHDVHSHMVLTFAVAERYREEPRITVAKDPRDLFMFQWGKAAIFAHHGDKAKPQQMALYLSDVCPFWSETRYRHFFSGHVHHDAAKDLGPLRWESLRAFCPPDAYAAGMGFGARRALQSVTFDKRDGLVLRAMDPIERRGN